jgi:hypothetical protein
MNAKLVNSAAGVINAALKQNRTATGIALALDSAQLLLTPETTAELKRLQDLVAELEEKSSREPAADATPGEAYPGELAMLRGLVATLRVVAEHADLIDVRQLLDEHKRDEQDAYAGLPDAPIPDLPAAVAELGALPMPVGPARDAAE